MATIAVPRPSTTRATVAHASTQAEHQRRLRHTGPQPEAFDDAAPAEPPVQPRTPDAQFFAEIEAADIGLEDTYGATAPSPSWAG